MMNVVPQMDEKDLVQMRNVLGKMADFIALFETAEDRMSARAKVIEERQLSNERLFNQRLNEIERVLDDVRGVMTEVGAARLRLMTENIVAEGKKHLDELEGLSKEYVAFTKETCDRLDKATTFTVKGVTQAITAFNPEEIRRLSQEASSQIKSSCTNSMRRITEIMKWFQIKNIGVIFFVTLFVTMITGLYINDEWPWEAHQSVVQQRNLAVAVANDWQQLSPNDQQRILQTESGQNIA